MKLLENELVKKYFGCHIPHPETVECIECHRATSRVLTAMDQPINFGEKYLDTTDFPVVKEVQAELQMDWMHFESLRLPDKFQVKICDCRWSFHIDELQPK